MYELRMRLDETDEYVLDLDNLSLTQAKAIVSLVKISRKRPEPVLWEINNYDVNNLEARMGTIS